MFISTPSLEPGNNSPGTESSKRKLLQQDSQSVTESETPKQTGPSEKVKKTSSSFSQPSEVAECFQLDLSSENNHSQKTQAFIVEEDSQATQIEGDATLDDKSISEPKCHSQNVSKNGLDQEPDKTQNSQNNVLDSKSAPENVENRSSQKCSQSGNVGNQDISATPSVTQSQLSVCVSDTPSAPQNSKTTDVPTSSSSPTSLPAAGPVTSTPVSVPSQSQSLSVLAVSSQKNAENETQHVESQRLSQPMIHSHSVITDSVKNTEEEDQMDEGEMQSTTKGKESGLDLALSQSEVLSPEPMEEEENGEREKEKPSDLQSSSKEDSFSVVVLEESQRVSQEKEKKDKRSQPFVSFSQPTRGSVQEKTEPTAKMSGSQPLRSTEASPLQLERTKSQSTKAGEAGQRKDQERMNSDNAANKSLSDSSGGGIILQTNDLLSKAVT